MFIRKFYDAAITEPAAAAVEPTPRFELLNEELSLEQAYQGFDDGKDLEKPKEETVVEEKVETPVVEPEKVEEPKKEEPILPTQAAPVVDWRAEVQKQDPKEIYKLLNIDESILNLAKDLEKDDFLKKAITYRKENGNLNPFIEAATTDWDKMPADRLILDDLKKQYSHLSTEKAEKLAKADYNSRFIYKEDPDLSEAENQELAELMSLKLESDVEKIRLARKQEQAQFLDSVKPIDKTAEQERIANETAAAEQKEFELWKSTIESHPVNARLQAEKKIVLGEKEKSFNYTVNPESIKDKTLNTANFYGQFWTKDESGSNVFNADKWNRVAAYAENPQAFEAALINHGMSLGTGEIVEKELVNQSPKSNQQSQAKSKSLAKTFVEEGQEITLEQLYGGGGTN